MKRLAFGFATAATLVGASAAPALAAPLRSDPVIGEPESVRIANPADITRIVYLNNCEPNGCQVRGGATDSRTGTSSVARNGVLGAFMYSDAQWQEVVSCVRDVLAPFDLQVTTTDPGATASHFEIMIAGIGSELGEQANTLGVSPYACNPNSNNNPAGEYIDNTLVFAFANDPYWATTGETITDQLCRTAAQELAHSFALDHTTDATDPMSYYPGGGRRYYKDARVCGSDCGYGGTPGVSPSGLTCTGSPAQEHPCVCANGSSNQDDVKTMLALFGPGTPVVPTVAITSPAAGATIHPGAHLEGTVTMDALLASATMKVDGTAIGSLTTTPFTFNLPMSTTTGSHTVELDVTDNHGTTGSASVMVNVTPLADLGGTCTGNGDCSTNDCASSGGDKVCSQACDPTTNPCPSGFDCDMSGSDGACFSPSGAGGGGGGGGGCDTRGTPGAPIALGLAFAALVFARRTS